MHGNLINFEKNLNSLYLESEREMLHITETCLFSFLPTKNLLLLKFEKKVAEEEFKVKL